MARKIVAVEPADDDCMTFYVFCDDGTVWSWVAPRHREKLNREEAAPGTLNSILKQAGLK